jgi:hypothetical protein
MDRLIRKLRSNRSWWNEDWRANTPEDVSNSHGKIDITSEKSPTWHLALHPRITLPNKVFASKSKNNCRRASKTIKTTTKITPQTDQRIH